MPFSCAHTHTHIFINFRCWTEFWELHIACLNLLIHCQFIDSLPLPWHLWIPAKPLSRHDLNIWKKKWNIFYQTKLNRSLQRRWCQFKLNGKPFIHLKSPFEWVLLFLSSWLNRYECANISDYLVVSMKSYTMCAAFFSRIVCVIKLCVEWSSQHIAAFIYY